MSSLGQGPTWHPQWDCNKCCIRALSAGALPVSDIKNLALPHYQHQSETLSLQMSPAFSTKLCPRSALKLFQDLFLHLGVP